MVETQFNLYPISPLLVQGGGISNTNPCNEVLVPGKILSAGVDQDGRRLGEWVEAYPAVDTKDLLQQRWNQYLSGRSDHSARTTMQDYQLPAKFRHQVQVVRDG